MLSAIVAVPSLAEKDRLEISGRIMLDADYFEEFHSKDGDSSTTDAELRLLRGQLDYDFPAGWRGQVQVDVNSDEVDLGSVWLRYSKWDFADVTLGKLKEPVGLERNTSSAKLMTIERSMMSTAFTPGKSWGLHLYDANKRRRWALSVAVEDEDDEDDDDFEEDNPYALSGRYTASPLNSDDETLQLGFSATLRDWNENRYQVRERAEVHTADNVVRSAAFRADQQATVGLEALWRRGSGQLQAEYMATRVEEIDGSDWDYQGYYVMASWFLGGEQRRFRKGEFRHVKPAGDYGAWELVARYGELDVRERGLGSVATMTTLGVNWYYNRDFRVMLNFLHPDISGSTRHADPDGNAVSLRLQLLL